MLGMIEINLLPPEFRVQERTPLGLFLTLVAGICVVSVAGLWGIQLSGELRTAKELKAQKQAEEATWVAKEAEVNAIRKDIEIAKQRQQTIIDISQTKIMWSQKLCQLGRILVDYPQFWIDRLQMDRQSGLSTSFFMVNEDLNKIAEFRETVMNDTSFWYHFSKFEANNYAKQKKYIVPSGPGGPTVTAETMISFAVRWPLR